MTALWRFAGFAHRVGKVTVDGDTAEVIVIDEDRSTVVVVKQDGDWLIDDIEVEEGAGK